MKTRVVLAVAAMLLPFPALANWGATRWGMTPEQVVAAVPGATATAMTRGSDVKGKHQLAIAPYTDAGVVLTASFLFDPQTNGLAFVGLVPDDPSQCEGYGKTLVARHGEGKVTEQPVGELKMGKIEWVEPGSRDRLMFSWIRRADASYAICKFIAEKP